ncbi:hypothetical protein SPRA44_640178 [Serratia proteamaculans]|nr:hypothetical protein SPRA44_640178 [Serratia proteamaculans]
MKYIELDMEVAGSALEQGVVLHTGIIITFSVGPQGEAFGRIIELVR